MSKKQRINGIGTSSAILSASKVVTMLIGLASGMLLSRFRTLEEYGTYSEILIVVTLTTSLFTLGLPNSTNYFLARSESGEKRRQFLSVFFTINTVICFVMGAALVIASPFIADYFGNSLINDFSFFLFFYPWTRVIISSISNILVVYGKTAKLLVFSIVNTTVSLAAILIVLVVQGTFRLYMILLLAGEILMMVWVYFMVWRLEHPLCLSLDKELVFKMLKYSIPIGLAGLVGTISIEIDKLMIGWFFDTEQLAVYTNAAKELPLTIVATSLTAVLLPQMARMLKANQTEQAVSLWGDAMRLSYIVICFFAMSLVVFAPQIITVLYSEKYLSGVPVFRIYSLHLLLRFTYFGLILNSIGKTKLIFYSSLISLVLNVIMNFALYYALGMIGPAIATALSMGIISIAQLVATGKAIKIPFSKLFPWNKLIQITGVNVCIGGALYLIVSILELGTETKDIIISIIIGVSTAIVYFALLSKKIRLLWKGLNNVDVTVGGED